MSPKHGQLLAGKQSFFSPELNVPY